MTKAPVFTFASVLGPPAAIAGLALILRDDLVEPIDLVLFASFYALTVVGISAGLHRLFAHRSFECGRGLRVALGILGGMAAQGPISFWVATHRKHHASSDGDGDPHTPQPRAGTSFAVLRGICFAHVGWMFRASSSGALKHSADLRRDADIRWLDRHYGLWVALGVLVPAAVGGVVGGDLESILRGALWGGFVRVFVVQHVTWSINSICHVYGSAPFETGDRSRNNVLCALLSFGEGWHNNHHACPYSARYGLGVGQIDVTYSLIRLFERVGLIWGSRTPDPAMLAAKVAVAASGDK